MSKMFALAAAATATLVAVAAPAAAQTMPSSPAQYVKEAGASDLFERQEARLMLQSTKNPQIRKFATKMIADHTKSTAQVKMAAMRAGMKPAAPHLDAKQQADYAKLRAASGTARDQLYLQQQLPAHQMALRVQQYYAQNGSSQPLKSTAAKIVPVVQGHIDMLQSMSS